MSVGKYAVDLKISNKLITEIIIGKKPNYDVVLGNTQSDLNLLDEYENMVYIYI